MKKPEKLSAKLPYGGIKKLAEMHECSRTHITNVLDGKTLGHPKILKDAERIILEEAKRKEAQQASYQSQKEKILKSVS